MYIRIFACPWPRHIEDIHVVVQPPFPDDLRVLVQSGLIEVHNEKRLAVFASLVDGQLGAACGLSNGENESAVRVYDIRLSPGLVLG